MGAVLSKSYFAFLIFKPVVFKKVEKSENMDYNYNTMSMTLHTTGKEEAERRNQESRGGI